MNRQVLAALVVVSATVLAGCGAFGGSESPTATPETASTTTNANSSTPERTATTDNRVSVYGDLAVNASLVWERLESLFGETYEPPSVIVQQRSGEPMARPLAAHLGLGEGADSYTDGTAGGQYLPNEDRVVFFPRNGSRNNVERILVHEFAHAIQSRIGLNERAPHGAAHGSVIEGGAVYIEDTYTREFLGFSSIERRCERYRNGSPYARNWQQSYCFGGEYFAETLDSPSDFLDPDLRLPNTTEQVLHPESTDQPRNLTVVDKTPRDWTTPATMERQGELFIRTVLGVELSEDRAADAAAGWGNDRLLTVTGDTEGYVWVLRWDTETDADGFESAFADYLDARGNKTADGWTVDNDRYRLSTIDERTVAVVTGNETFVESVMVTKDDKNITVSADGSA